MENVGGIFQDITAGSGLGPWLDLYGIQALFRDFDNDGFVDLLVTSTDVAGGTPAYRLFRNDGDKTFTHQAGVFVVGGTTGGAGTPLDYIHSCAVGDLNHDGFLDIYTGRGSGFNGSTSQPDLLFMNGGNAGNHFISFQLTGTVSNRNAIGARIEIFGPWGVQTREVRSGEGYGIMNSLNTHFGLGAATTIDRVLVSWPSGFTTELTDVAADQFLPVTEVVAPGEFSRPALTSPAGAESLTNSNFVYRIYADHHPDSFSIANAPAGMVVSETGTVTWRPRAAGEFTFDVTASNIAGSDSQTVTVRVLPNLLAPAIEAEDFPVTSSPQDPWTVQTAMTHDQSDAAQAGSIGDSESSWLAVEVDGPGEATFWWRVSSEEVFDELRVLLGDTQIDAISGLSGWQQRAVTVPAGSHTIRWAYEKDGSESHNQDTGWVDEFNFVSQDTDGDGLLDSWETTHFGNLDQDSSGDADGDGQDHGAEQASGTDPNDPLSALRVTSIGPLGDGEVSLTWDSVSGIEYGIQRSTDLTSWSLVGAAITGTGSPINVTAAGSEVDTESVELIGEVAPAHAIVPTAATPLTNWRGGDELAFADAGGLSGWTAGNTGVGYERSGTRYVPYIGLDVGTDMYTRNSSVFIRVPFTANAPHTFDSLALSMRYDDGFSAFINGQAVRTENFSGLLAWDAEALDFRSDTDAEQFFEFDISAAIGALVEGQNILAIHGLNDQPSSSDLLIQPKLVAERQLDTPGERQVYWRVVVIAN